jgi:hypothetical protein
MRCLENLSDAGLALNKINCLSELLEARKEVFRGVLLIPRRGHRNPGERCVFKPRRFPLHNPLDRAKKTSRHNVGNHQKRLGGWEEAIPWRGSILIRCARSHRV